METLSKDKYFWIKRIKQDLDIDYITIKPINPKTYYRLSKDDTIFRWAFNGDKLMGSVALTHAVHDKNKEKIKILLEHGIDPNISDNWDCFPLTEAYDIEIIEMLLEYGADPNIYYFGMTPLIHTINHHEKHKIEKIKILLENGADPNIQDDSGFTPLMWAVYKPEIEIVKILLKTGADPNIRDNNGMTALNRASLEGYTEIFQLLLENGAE